MRFYRFFDFVVPEAAAILVPIMLLIIVAVAAIVGYLYIRTKRDG